MVTRSTIFAPCKSEVNAPPPAAAAVFACSKSTPEHPSISPSGIWRMPPLFVLVREYWPPLISICLHLCGSRRRDTARPLLPTASHLRCAPNSHDNASHVVLTMQGPNSRSDSSIPAPSSSRTCPTSHESAVIDKCSTALRPLLLQFTLTMSSSLPLSKR